MPASQKKILVLFFLAITIMLVCPSFVLAQNDHRGLEIVAAPIAGSEPVGQQYAVFIAIDRYKEWPPLKNAVSDAEQIRAVLQNRYYIDQSYTLYDDQATKEKVMKLFENLSNELQPEDSLFVFYAGHGVMDPLTKIGSWILQDAGTNRYEQKGWLDNPKIRSLLSTVRSKHVLLVSDSCFSGDILNVERGTQIEITDDYFKKAYARRSRQVLTSGASESVPDQSVFTRALIRLFEENSKPYLDPLMLFNEIRLTKDLTTSPLLGTLRDTDSQEGGSFIFFLKQAQPQKFKVVYNANGAMDGIAPTDTNEYVSGSFAQVLSPGPLVKNGYEFAGWNTRLDGSGAQYAVGSTLTLRDSDVTLYARWTMSALYRVYYNANGATRGIAPIDTTRYASGAIIKIPSAGNLSRDGYEFTGWNTTPEGTGFQYSVDSTTFITNSDITLYARWVPVNQYRVIYIANGATGGAPPVDNSFYAFNMRTKVLGPSKLVKTGYEFAGWNTKADGTGKYYNPGDEITFQWMDAPLYAQWKKTVALKPQTGWIDFSNVPLYTDIYLDGNYLRSGLKYATSSYNVVEVGSHKVELIYHYSPTVIKSFYEMLNVSPNAISKPRESLIELADYLEQEKQTAEEYQSKSKSRSTKVFLSLAGLGAAGICYLAGQAAYTNYQSASDPLEIAAYRLQAEFLSSATIASLAFGAIFTIQLPAAKVPPKPDTNGMSFEAYIQDLDITITRIRSNL